MLIRFWCDSEITVSRGLHKNLVTELYYSIINVLCGAGGEASFAPQANLVLSSFSKYRIYSNKCPYFNKCLLPRFDNQIHAHGTL